MNLESIFDFGADFNIVMLIITALLAMRAMPFKNKRLQYLLIYVGYTIISNVVIYLTKDHNNLYISYISTPIYVVLFTLLLLPEKKEVFAFKLSLLLMAIAISLNFYEAFLVDGGVRYYNSIANAFISIFLGALAIRGLLKLRYDDRVLNLASEPLFWVLVAITIKNVGNLISTGFYKSLQDTEGDLLLKVVFSSMVVNYIGLILYWIAFIKAKKNDTGSTPKLAT